MSFASRIKKELTQIKARSCCKRAELSAFIRMNGTIQLKKQQRIIDIPTENPATARYVFSLIKQLFPVQPEVLVQRKARLKKNNVYLLRLLERTDEILTHLGILKAESLEWTLGIAPNVITDSCCKKAYLRGAFLAGGSVNHPSSASYHLEIVSTYYDHGQALCELMDTLHLHPKMIERKKGFVVYLKEGDRIGQFLNIVGAHPSLLQFEDIRIMKDMRNSVNRLVNCETANLNKVIHAAMRQIKNIELIDQEVGLQHLPDKLREIAEVRLRHPEMNLTELGQMLPGGKVSKSTVNHRLRKIEALAEDLRLKGARRGRRKDQN